MDRRAWLSERLKALGYSRHTPLPTELEPLLKKREQMTDDEFKADEFIVLLTKPLS